MSTHNGAEHKRDYAALNERLLEDLETYLDAWLPGGKRRGNDYVAINPTRNDKSAGSFRVCLHASPRMLRGGWIDFAYSDTDKGKDPISLYAYLNNIGQSEAYDRLAENTNIQYVANYGTPRVLEKPQEPEPEEWELLDWPADKRPRNNHFMFGAPSAIYHYRNFEVWRFEFYDEAKQKKVKETWPISYRRNIATGKKSFRWKAPFDNRPLYHLEQFEANPDRPVLLVEGEKAADIVVPGLTVMTWSGGTNGIFKSDWSTLKGAKKVFIWRDRDEPGLRAGEKLATLFPDAMMVRTDFSIDDGMDIADISLEQIVSGIKWAVPPLQDRMLREKDRAVIFDIDTINTMMDEASAMLETTGLHKVTDAERHHYHCDVMGFLSARMPQKREWDLVLMLQTHTKRKLIHDNPYFYLDRFRAAASLPSINTVEQFMQFVTHEAKVKEILANNGMTQLTIVKRNGFRAQLPLPEEVSGEIRQLLAGFLGRVAKEKPGAAEAIDLTPARQRDVPTTAKITAPK